MCEMIAQGCGDWISAFPLEAAFAVLQLPYLEGGSPQRKAKLAK